MPIVAIVAVDDAANWLCGENLCVLLASIDDPVNVKDYIVNHQSCCASVINVPRDFIVGLEKIYGIHLSSNLCKAHIEKPLQYVDDVSLLIQTTRLLTDPVDGFGLKFIQA